MSLRLSHISSHGTCFVKLHKPVWNCNFIDKLLSVLSTLASFKSRWQISPAWRSKMGPSERSPHKKWYYFRHFEGYSFWLISLHFCLSMILCKLFSYVFFFRLCGKDNLSSLEHGVFSLIWILPHGMQTRHEQCSMHTESQWSTHCWKHGRPPALGDLAYVAVHVDSKQVSEMRLCLFLMVVTK